MREAIRTCPAERRADPPAKEIGVALSHASDLWQAWSRGCRCNAGERSDPDATIAGLVLVGAALRRYQVSGVDLGIAGAYQLTIPVSSAEQLLEPEMRLLAVLRHALRAVPVESPWYAAMSRYAAHVAARVRGSGGDPDSVRPSPAGGEGKDEWEARHSLLGRLCRLVGRIARCRARCGRARWRCRCES